MIPYEIIATGSSGNAVIVNKSILIDCGVPFKQIKPYLHDIKLVLLTHKHSDHFKHSTIRKIAQERPTVRFGCGEWLVGKVIDAGVKPGNIDVLETGKMYGYGICNVIPIPLSHDVPNQGYKLHFPQGKVIYATDTGNLNGIHAWHYNLYLLEANYSETDIQAKIEEKKINGEYVYEKRVLRTHLSKEQCDDFFYKNRWAASTLVYLHCHEEEESNG